MFAASKLENLFNFTYTYTSHHVVLVSEIKTVCIKKKVLEIEMPKAGYSHNFNIKNTPIEFS